MDHWDHGCPEFGSRGGVCRRAGPGFCQLHDAAGARGEIRRLTFGEAVSSFFGDEYEYLYGVLLLGVVSDHGGIHVGV